MKPQGALGGHQGGWHRACWRLGCTMLSGEAGCCHLLRTELRSVLKTVCCSWEPVWHFQGLAVAGCGLSHLSCGPSAARLCPWSLRRSGQLFVN